MDRLSARYRRTKKERDFCQLAVAMAPFLLHAAVSFQLDDPWEALFLLQQAASKGKRPLSRVVWCALFDARRKEWTSREARERYVEETIHLAEGLYTLLEDPILFDQLEKKLITPEERFFLEASVLCGISLVDLAQSLGVSEDVARQRYKRLKEDLRVILRDPDG